MCPHCQSLRTCKKGTYQKKSGPEQRVQRYLCKACRKSFSTQTTDLTYREQKPEVNSSLFRLLCSGVSQRRCGILLGISRHTVARKLVKMGAWSLRALDEQLPCRPISQEVTFDEMETFEHTKCKPLSIALAVDDKTRRILGLKVAQMPAKGLLAKKSREKYGPRGDHRPKALKEVFGRIRRFCPWLSLLKSDQNPRYSGPIAKFFPDVHHEAYKGRRGCVTGQGELKEGGYDPLFSLNHTAAMIRDNLKTLSRRTWCTVKKPDRLQALLNLYALFHNGIIDGKKGPVPAF